MLNKQNDTVYDCESCKSTTYNNPAACVTALVLDKSREKLLMAVRGRSPKKGKLDFPGGFVDAGETPEEALHREMAEETSLKVKILGILGAYSNHYTEFRWTSDIAYVVEVEEGNPKPGDDVAELDWREIDSLTDDELAFEPMKQELRDLKATLLDGKYQ